MTIHELQAEILRVKQEKNICIVAHSYQAREIIEVADFTGDSYTISVAATKTDHENVIMCGVRFMAETVKILSPAKRVLLANPEAGCPMAEQLTPEMLIAVKQQHPDYAVVAYVNTTAELKALSDVCVTSSSAVSIVSKLDNPNILFIPDCNLGDYVAKQLPEKNVKLLQGGCPIHADVTVEDVDIAKERYPGVQLLVHPECIPGVVAAADFVGSTSAIMDYAQSSPNKEFLIGTEMSIVEHLQYICPSKKFHCLSSKLLCPDMKLTTLMDVYHAVIGEGGVEITLSSELIEKAGKCIHEMVRLGQ